MLKSVSIAFKTTAAMVTKKKNPYSLLSESVKGFLLLKDWFSHAFYSFPKNDFSEIEVIISWHLLSESEDIQML